MGAFDDAVRATDSEGISPWSADLPAVKLARQATGRLRDAARTGTIIEFRERDRLVMAIHDALDLVMPDTASKD